MAFVHLHTHSSYSPMWGVPTVEALCQAVKDQGQEYLALTDTNGLYGTIRFLKVAREHGLKPIIGAELVSGQHRAVLLAKNPTGYANLCLILSARHCDASFNVIQTVAQHRTGLFILSDDPIAVTAWQTESEADLYVELTPGPALQDAVELSRRLRLPPTATTRAAFLQPADYQAHRLLRTIAENTTLSRLKADRCALPSHWLMPESVLARHLPHVPQALTNTRWIAEQCHTDWDFKQTIFPSFRQLSSGAAFETLQRKTNDGAIWRYGALSPVVRERIEKELTVIRDKGYADYFLVVDEIVRQAPRTCGRGSAAASIVSYCLGITHVDPIKHNLLFERFLNPGRHDPPDIDVDFPWDERPAILEWVFKQYGHQHAAMVANQNTLATRAALREIAKVYGLPAGEIGKALNFLQRRADFVDVRPGMSVQDWARDVCRALNLRNPWPEILYWSTQLDGHFRNLGLHPGGVVLVPDEIRRYVPVEISASNLPMIQWEKDQTEEAGLVKIDLLGNRSLAVIRDAIAAVTRNTGRVIDYATWDPITDPATNDLIRLGETMGCFYVESPATRLLLKKLWGGMPPARRAVADVFEYLVVVSSIIRPAANVFADEFVRRAHGQRYQSPHPLLDEILAETHGIMVYQEDVMKVAVALGGFSVEDGDQLRKVLSKKHKERQLRDYQRQFYQGAMARGVEYRVIDAIWAMIMSFSGYSFCKPHSASYAQVSFKSAYLRAHYPAEFVAAVVSNQGGYYSAFAYLSEGRRMGLTVLPPDINASAWAYSGSGTTVRVGLMQIKGLQEDLAQRIIAEREQHGPYRSLSDFLSRIKLDYAQAKLLIKAGSFDSIAGELTRPAILWRVFATQATRPPTHIPIPMEYSPQKKLHHELALFGFPLRCHPLDLFTEALAATPRIRAKDLEQYVGKEVTLIGWLLTEKIVSTKKGEPMEFMTLEDQTGMYDATLFPNRYREYCHLLAPNQAYVVTGLVEEHFSTVTVTVKTLQLLTTGAIPAPSEPLEELRV
ncbi:DNA polymerase III subunit alpha [Candidatus Nitrospira nitrificans]|uniref:DNA-directed DNA polymerase n=1 Tax=Candidatus Nitrospira nitrificans TaxID=1742973 RepID=A0A0S4LS59_9BACT|nr:DNA polymerase III subunit alpha [Candidatus Nitrospira nitrificans]CUS37922.1 DNA polymerase III, alpha subunit [Candidatus Nitrospira nitrificans]